MANTAFGQFFLYVYSYGGLSMPYIESLPTQFRRLMHISAWSVTFPNQLFCQLLTAWIIINRSTMSCISRFRGDSDLNAA